MRDDGVTPIRQNIVRREAQIETRSRPVTAVPTEAASYDELDIIAGIGTLWRGKWIIALFAFLFAGVGGYYAYKVAVPEYGASTELLLEVRGQNVVDVESVVSGIGSDDYSINTEVSKIRARRLLEEMVRDLNLVEDPEFNSRLREEPAFSRKVVIEWVRGILGRPAAEVEEPTEERIFSDVVNAVARDVSVSNRRATYIFQIYVQTEDPEKSVLMANRLAELYLADQIEAKFAATEYAVNWLSQRVTELELELKEKEDAVEEKRAAFSQIDPATFEALSLRARELRERLVPLRQELDTSKVRLAGMRAALEIGDFEGMAARTQNPAIAGRASDAAAGDVAAQQAIRTALQAEATQLEGQIARLEDEVARLQGTFDSVNSRIEAQNAARLELGTLVREANATRVLYETFLTRLKETSIQIGLQQADSRILSAADFGKLVAPNRNRMIMLTFLLGALLGSGLVVLRQVLRHGFRTSDEVEAATGYPVIGQVPVFKVRRRGALPAYLRKNPTSAASESIRNLRTSVLMSNLDTPPKLIMVSSSVPGEGKTTTSIGLAHNLAGMGHKVLLLEGDIRRRTLSVYFKEKSRGQLLNVVAQTVDIEDAVIHSEELGIDVLMSHRSTVNAADLFSSNKFEEMMQSLREKYDFVVIDTPPVLVVPDSRIIGALADSILYCVHWNKTTAEQVNMGLRQFASVNLRVNGLVLTKVDPRGMKRYGYGSRYGSYAQYGKGYYDT